MIVNRDGHPVPVLHAQGQSLYEYPDLLADAMNRPASVPPWVGIVTCCNAPMLPQAILIDQLNENGIDYVNPAMHIVEWANALKPGLIVKGIDRLRTPYVLVLDALDVALNGDFIAAVPAYCDYGKAILFGATRTCSPDCDIDFVADRESRGEYRWLNAGTAFGPREAMRVFYGLVDDLTPGAFREQQLVREVFGRCQSWVDFDWRCQMFQTLGRAMVEDVDGAVRVS